MTMNLTLHYTQGRRFNIGGYFIFIWNYFKTQTPLVPHSTCTSVWTVGVELTQKNACVTPYELYDTFTSCEVLFISLTCIQNLNALEKIKRKMCSKNKRRIFFWAPSQVERRQKIISKFCFTYLHKYTVYNSTPFHQDRSNGSTVIASPDKLSTKSSS